MDPEERVFTGEPDAALEQWLGGAFESWVPSQQQVVIRLSGHAVTLAAGARLWQLAPGYFIVGGDSSREA